MGYTADLLGGLSALLADAGLGVYRPGGIYADGETGIFHGVIPEGPDRAICLTPYPVEDTDLTDTITGVQVRLRAGPETASVLDLADGVFAALHNRRALAFGSVRVALIWRQSQALLGQDPHGRTELAGNYYARTTRTAPHLID
ncbi:minor capsid protein [Streptomyces sp. NPDC001985]|uniref:minor capsid protein n=1 Tax=Streptomyces sp. NPDC001985 TaxID=3154406 RepID=UPI00332B7257